MHIVFVVMLPSHIWRVLEGERLAHSAAGAFLQEPRVPGVHPLCVAWACRIEAGRSSHMTCVVLSVLLVRQLQYNQRPCTATHCTFSCQWHYLQIVDRDRNSVHIQQPTCNWLSAIAYIYNHFWRLASRLAVCKQHLIDLPADCQPRYSIQSSAAVIAAIPIAVEDVNTAHTHARQHAWPL